MATDFQHDFVINIEASIRALSVQGKGPPTISAIMEDAGYDAGGLFVIVQRLKDSGEKELLSRLRSAFEYAKKLPSCLEDVKASKGGFSIEGASSASPIDSEPRITLFDLQEEERARSKPKPGKVTEPPGYPITPKYPPTEDEATALSQILSILRPLKHQGRSRILGASSMFYGVGE